MPLKKNPATQILCIALMLSLFLGMSIDFYLPTFNAIKQTFHSTQNIVQYTITLFLILYAISQLIFGWLLDYLGRKKVILIGLGIYTVASILCVTSQSIKMLIFSRGLQGIGAASAIITAYAIIQDHYTTESLSKPLSYVAVGVSIFPMLLSISGGYINTLLSWKWIFIIASAVSVFVFIYIILNFEENFSSSIKTYLIKSMLINYRNILINKEFIIFTICSSTIFIILIGFVSLAPLYLMEKYSLSTKTFGFSMALNSLFIALGSYISAKTISTLKKPILLASLGILIISITMLYTKIFFLKTIYLIPMYIISILLGLIMPLAQTGLLIPFADHSGQANALSGFIRFCSGGLVAIAINNTKHFYMSLVLITIACALINIMSLLTLKK